jgi:hypothetical protein
MACYVDSFTFYFTLYTAPNTERNHFVLKSNIAEASVQH